MALTDDRIVHDGRDAPELRVAFIGCGGIATSQHAPAYRRVPGVRVIAGCDVDRARAEAFVGTFGGMAYEDYVTMLRRERPDVVNVCTPEHQHVEPTIAALEAGAHVMCEKIMAHTLDGGHRMVEAARRTGRHLAVDYNYRFMPIFARLREMIVAGEVGEVAMLTAFCHAYCFHHAIDLLRFLGGAEVGEPTHVFGQYEVTADPRHHFRVQCPDFVYVPSRSAALTLRFANGALGTVQASRFAELSDLMLDVDVVGEKGRLSARNVTIDDVVGRLVRYPGGQEVTFYDGEERGFQLAFHGSLSAFVSAIRAGAAPPVTGFDGLRVLQIEAGLVASQRTGGMIELDPT